MDTGAEVQKARGATFAPPGRRAAVRPGQSATHRFFRRLSACVSQVRDYLDTLASPAGVLQGMKDRLTDAQRDLRRANDPEERGRIEHEIALLQQDIADQQRVVDDLKGVERQVEESIARGFGTRAPTGETAERRVTHQIHQPTAWRLPKGISKTALLKRS